MTYHCALCPSVDLQSWQTHIENAQRVHTGCGGPVDDPDLLGSLAATICTWANAPRPREELRLRILRELQALHAAAFRAGQERMRERALAELEWLRDCSYADAIRALPLEAGGMMQIHLYQGRGATERAKAKFVELTQQQARNAALEEAARAAEAVGEERPKVWTGGVVARACAAAIRALKEPQE